MLLKKFLPVVFLVQAQLSLASQAIWEIFPNTPYDVSAQIPSQPPRQSANTCFLHSSVALLEAAAFRANGTPLDISDDSAVLGYLQALVQPPAGLNSDYVKASQKILSENLVHIQKGKIKSPADYGFLDREVVQLLINSHLVAESTDSKIPAILSSILSQSLVTSKNISLQSFSTNPLNMDPKEFFGLEVVRDFLNLLQSISLNERKVILPQVEIENLHVNQLVLSETGSNARFMLKEALKPFSRFAEKAPTPANFQELDERRDACDEISWSEQITLLDSLRQGLPVAVGLYPNGVEFLTDEGIWTKVYRESLHAMVLVKAEVQKNEKGELEPYWIFRDSGFFKNSSQARVPLRETCRILKTVIVR